MRTALSYVLMLVLAGFWAYQFGSGLSKEISTRFAGVSIALDQK